ncbi:putative MRG protein, partial [Trypoxylus dichotomus]
KLPELLNNTNMPDEKLKVLLSHLNLFIDFLNDHKEWYGERFYKENDNNVE